MDALAEATVAAREPRVASGAPRWLAPAPADATRVARWLAGSASPAACGAAVVVVGATARLSVEVLAGIRAFLQRHPGPCAVVVDRMDDAGCEYVVFDAQRARLAAAGIVADLIVPAISSTGEGIVSGADRIDWHRGPTLGQWLGSLPPPAGRRGGGAS